ncbi:MAG TPA: hypothetical protein VJL86_12150 [Steroidobacteraceae bacterium]|nr:hypothetical protein [Steroidobacteraceae bacterium]
MSEAKSFSAGAMAGRIAIALAQGFLLWWLYDAVTRDRWPEDLRGWLVGLIAAGTLVPLAHYLISDLAPAARQWPLLAGLALLTLGLGWHHGAWTAEEPYQFPAFALALFVLVFHAMPFAQSALVHGTLLPRYEVLFHFAWRNALLGALGALFTGVFWLLLVLWGELFSMLGIDFFSDLFQTPRFAIPATAVVVGIGVQLAGSVERLQGALRQQLLALLKWLAPLAAFILTLFTVALLAKSPELFAEQRRAISAVWLLWLVALTVALLNAAYQDGRDEEPYPRWLGTAIRYAGMLLLPVALLAVYALAVRIATYGLTPSRGWGFLVALVALGYAGGYAWAAARRGAWMAGVGIVNVSIALFTIVAMTLMLTPLLSPERLAAASQYERVLADPEVDAYADLRFRTGRYGRERLAELAAIEGHARAADIRARATKEIKRQRPGGGTPAAGELTSRQLVVFPSTSRPEPGLLAVLNTAQHRHVLVTCTEEEPCPLLFADLNRDGEAEAILFATYGIVGATRDGNQWRALDRLVRMGACASHNDRETIIKALEGGEYRVGDLPWQPIEINGELYLLADPPADRRCDEDADGVSRDPASTPEGP